MEQMTTLRDLVGQVIQKKEEEKRIAEEQAAKDRYWKIPICYIDMTKTPQLQTTPVLPTGTPRELSRQWSGVMWGLFVTCLPLLKRSKNIPETNIDYKMGFYSSDVTILYENIDICRVAVTFSG
ncbi:hypothetical protein Tco_0701666 [Tanacetum coccineum]